VRGMGVVVVPCDGTIRMRERRGSTCMQSLRARLARGCSRSSSGSTRIGSRWRSSPCGGDAVLVAKTEPETEITFEQLAEPTPTQRKTFEVLRVSIPRWSDSTVTTPDNRPVIPGQGHNLLERSCNFD